MQSTKPKNSDLPMLLHGTGSGNRLSRYLAQRSLSGSLREANGLWYFLIKAALPSDGLLIGHNPLLRVWVIQHRCLKVDNPFGVWSVAVRPCNSNSNWFSTSTKSCRHQLVEELFVSPSQLSVCARLSRCRAVGLLLWRLCYVPVRKVLLRKVHMDEESAAVQVHLYPGTGGGPLCGGLCAGPLDGTGAVATFEGERCGHVALSESWSLPVLRGCWF